jgi:hypothetical protein
MVGVEFLPNRENCRTLKKPRIWLKMEKENSALRAKEIYSSWWRGKADLTAEIPVKRQRSQMQKGSRQTTQP